MHTHSLAEYMKCLYRGDWQGVGELMLASANKLATIGADFLICPDNTIHQALPYVEPRSPLPWLHIAEVVAAEAVERGFRRLGLTGTRWLVDSEVYPEKARRARTGVSAPDAAEREEINRIIMDELVCGVFKPEAVAYFQRVIARHERRGLRRRRARLHRDPADHERREFSAADARFHTPAGAGGAAPGGAGDDCVGLNIPAITSGRSPPPTARTSARPGR